MSDSSSKVRSFLFRGTLLLMLPLLYSLSACDPVRFGDKEVAPVPRPSLLEAIKTGELKLDPAGARIELKGFAKGQGWYTLTFPIKASEITQKDGKYRFSWDVDGASARSDPASLQEVFVEYFGKRQTANRNFSGQISWIGLDDFASNTVTSAAATATVWSRINGITRIDELDTLVSVSGHWLAVEFVDHLNVSFSDRELRDLANTMGKNMNALMSDLIEVRVFLRYVPS